MQYNAEIKTNCLGSHAQTCMLENPRQSVPISHSLIIEATAAAGGIAVFGDAVSELAVQHVGHGPRDSLPSQNEDDDDSVGTVVASTLTHQTHQLLCLAVATDHLTGNTAYYYFSFSSSRGGLVSTSKISIHSRKVLFLLILIQNYILTIGPLLTINHYFHH